MKNKKLKVGELVQIWDNKPDPSCGVTLSGHGEIGYLIETLRQDDDGRTYHLGWRVEPGSIWQVICLGEDPPMTYSVHEDWLRPIHTSSDIKKKT